MRVATEDDLMELALAEARTAIAHGDVPVGAVAALSDAGGFTVLSRRHNERELRRDPTAHAELLALRDASVELNTWRLDGVTLAVTLEPCPMCAGALVASRLGALLYGAADLKGGACGSLYNLCADPRLNHDVPVTVGVRADECAAVLADFFGTMREH